MSIEVRVPQLPESVSDATLVGWHKSAGEKVSRDENLVDLETDKVVLEVPAPSAGVLKEILIEDGATVTAGDVLAILEEGEGGAAAAAPARKPEEKSEKTGAVAEKKAEAKTAKEPEEAPAAAERGAGAGKLSPAVRRLVEEHDLDPGAIEGSGKDGRITKADVLDYLDQHADETSDAEVAAPTGAPSAGPSRNEQRVPMTRLRARIAERMVEAQQAAAMLTTFNEVDLGEVMALRSRYKESFEKTHGVKLGFMSFFVKAAIEALRRFPVVNASVEDRDIIYHDYYDIGIAVSTERGLLVPVLRDADQLSFAAVENTIADFGKRAREGSIGIEELTGGTFTITNGGIFGSMMSTPILNPPQSAILGMHKIQDRPMAVNGTVEIRPMMYLALTYDHRIIDGREAVQFLVSIKESLEDPARLMLQV